MSYLLLVDYDFPPELHDQGSRACTGRTPQTWRSASASPPRPARSFCGRQAAQVPAGRAGRQGLEAAQTLPLRLQPLHGGLHGAQAQRAEAAQDGGERGRREGGEAHPERHLRPLLHEPRQVQEHERLRGPGQGKSSVTNFELQINDSEGFLAFVETLKTDRSKACMSVPTQFGARTLQLSKLMMEKAYYLHMRRLFRGHRLRDGADLRAGPAPRHGRGEPERRPPSFDVAGKSEERVSELWKARSCPRLLVP